MREKIRDKGRLEHIIEAITYVKEFVGEREFEDFRQDKLRLYATIYNVQIIGEAVYKLSTDFKGTHQDVPWNLIEKMRHILVHDYFQINVEILWAVIIDDLPELEKHVTDYLSEMDT